jgi:(p)ppGpp synthase/HD superfamily hydrolase
MDKLMYAGMKDVRCFLLKLADREDNLKTLGNLKAHKQVRMAFETQAIFTPLEIILKFPRLNSILESRKNLESYLVRE